MHCPHWPQHPPGTCQPIGHHPLSSWVRPPHRQPMFSNSLSQHKGARQGPNVRIPARPQSAGREGMTGLPQKSLHRPRCGQGHQETPSQDNGSHRQPSVRPEERRRIAGKQFESSSSTEGCRSGSCRLKEGVSVCFTEDKHSTSSQRLGPGACTGTREGGKPQCPSPGCHEAWHRGP